MPDIRGLALRVVLDEHRVDLLFATVGRRRATARLFVPATGWLTRPYTTLLPYLVDGEHVTLGLHAEPPGHADDGRPGTILEQVRRAPIRLVLAEQRKGEWKPIGSLTLIGHWEGEPVSFDPLINAHPKLRHTRAFVKLRERAYRGSRQGRDADPESLSETPEG